MGIGKIGWSDVSHAAVNAVIAGVIFALAGIVSQANFDLFATNWSQVLNTIINAGFIAFVTSVARAFGSDKDGKLFGSKSLS